MTRAIFRWSNLFSKNGSAQKMTKLVIPFESSIFSYQSILFSWIEPLIKIGEKRKLAADDFLQLSQSANSKQIHKDFKKCWSSVKIRRYSCFPIPRLGIAIHRLISKNFWKAGFYRCLNDVLVMLNPYLIKILILSAEDNKQMKMLIIAFIISFATVFQAICLQQFIHGCFMSAATATIACTSLVFDSILELKLQKLYPSRSIGEINNIQSKDTSSIQEFVVFAHNLWACPLMVIACVGFLFYLLGWAGLVSCILLPLLLPLESYLSKLERKARKDVLQHSDLRMAKIYESIEGIRTLKFTHLCHDIYETISKLRLLELQAAWKGMLLSVTNSVITQSSTIIVTVCTFTVYIWLSPVPLTADRAFTALSIINIISRPMKVIPKSISLFSDAWVAILRMEKLTNDSNLFHIDQEEVGNSNDKRSINENKVSNIEPPSIIIRNMNVIRPPDKVVLRVDELMLQGPGLVVLVGGNASGKSSLLLAIMAELQLLLVQDSKDTSTVRESVTDNNTLTNTVVTVNCKGGVLGYCGHDPWILNDTVLNNIICGKSTIISGSELSEIVEVNSLTVEENKLQDVIAACGLDHDISSWVDGLSSLIGERGINISGGQKSRLALARALYSDANILLLDSPLASVDAILSAHVFDEAILKAAKQRLVILTTHDARLIERADRIIGLENGTIVFDGNIHQFDILSLPIRSLFGQFSSVNSSSHDTINKLSTKLVNENTEKIITSKKSIMNGRAASVKDKSSSSYHHLSTSIYWQYIRACGLFYFLIAVFLSIFSFVCIASSDWTLRGYTDGVTSTSRYLLIYCLISGTIVIANFFRFFAYVCSGMQGSKHLHHELLVRILGAPLSFFVDTPSGKIASRFAADFDVIDFNITDVITSFLDASLGILTGVGVLVIMSPWCLFLVVPLSYQYFKVQERYRPTSIELKRADSAAKAPLFSHFSEILAGLEVVRGYKIQQDVLAKHYLLLDNKLRARLNWDAANRWLGVRLDLIGALIVSVAAFAVAFSGSSGGTAGLMLSYAAKATISLSFAVRSFTALENQFTSPERVIEYLSLPQEVSSGDWPLHSKPSTLINRFNENQVNDDSKLKLLLGKKAVERDNGVTLESLPLLSTTDFQGVYDIDEHTGNGKAAAGRLVEEGIEMIDINHMSTTILETEHITATYSSDLPPTLTDVSFRIEANQFVGLCGRSGSGKSTLTLVIARALQDITGNLTLLNRNVQSYPLFEYRSLVQVYPQDHYIFSGRLREILDPNHVHSDLRLQELLSSLSAVFTSTVKNASTAYDNTEKLSDPVAIGQSDNQLRLDMMITAGGANLSSGQRQVICLSRAALSSASVLILDECCSSMDAQGGARALQVLRTQLLSSDHPRCVLMIGHRLQDVALCDDVWVMADGEIIERGAPESLLNKEYGIFANMSSYQNATA